MRRVERFQIARALRAGVLLLLLAGACGGEESTQAPELPRAEIRDGPHDVAVIRMGDLGTIRFELLPELAPKTVAHFTRLANEGFYDGTTFHRVVPGFMIQGGDPQTRDNDPRNDGKGVRGYRIEDEFTDLPHVRGVVAMANTGGKDSGAHQFFIVQADSPHLDGRHTIFGRVVEGMDVVDAVTRLEIDTYGRYGPPERPYPVDARMESVRVEPAAAAAP